MKKILSLLVLITLGCGLSRATDSISVKSDTLAMSVVPPVLTWGENTAAQGAYKADYLYIPLVFEEYMPTDSVADCEEAGDLKLDVNDGWLKSAVKDRKRVKKMRYDAMIANPENVHFNGNDLPEPPKTYLIKTDPTKRMVTIEERKIEKLAVVDTEAVKVKNWIHSFNGSVLFSQSYLS